MDVRLYSKVIRGHDEGFKHISNGDKSAIAGDNCLVGLNCGIRVVLALDAALKARHPASRVNEDASA